MTTKYEIEGSSLEDAIRKLIDEAAGGDVDIHLRTRGYDPRVTGPTTLNVVVEDPSESDDDSDDDSDQDSADSSDDQSDDQSDDASSDQDEAPAPRARARKERSDDDSASDARSAQDDDDDGDTPSVEELEEEADAAADFLEGLLDVMDVPGDLKIRILEGEAEVEVVEADSGTLIGRRGQTLEAIQELARCSLQREFQRRTRVTIDIEGYRARRLEKLLDKADEAIDDVLDGNGPARLEPMDVFERKAVHKLVDEVEGVVSRSTGREPGRRVVIELDD